MELIDTHKYTSPYVIMDRIARVHKNKQLNIDDIISWTAELEVNYLRDTNWMIKYINITFDVTNGYMVALPCNLWRILDVYELDEVTRIQNINNGSYLSLLNGNWTQIKMNYYGVPVHPTEGYVLILKGHEEAHEAYCLTKLYEEDFMTGKIDANRWVELNQRLGHYITTCKNNTRYIQRNDYEELSMVAHNIIRFPNKIPIKRGF